MKKRIQSTADLLAGHVHNEGSALLVDLPTRFLEVFQEFHKVLGHLVRIKAGVAANGRTGGLAFLGFCCRRSAVRKNNTLGKVLEMFWITPTAQFLLILRVVPNMRGSLYSP